MEIYYNSLGKYQSYIDVSKWYLRAIVNTALYSSEDFYQIERGINKSYSGGDICFRGNIGLIYASDYGYSIEKNIEMEKFMRMVICIKIMHGCIIFLLMELKKLH